MRSNNSLIIASDTIERLLRTFFSNQKEGFKTLQEGDEVTFKITQSDKGPQASNIETV
ncbi:MAG: hypothetical protein B6227_06535 [Fusobacteriia bacterium 4572_74]|nr:MAG: hypothetical protein B6227_06535 [Fusobacteriia bacterium 4572_74]